jgi:hypothetical protein
MKRVLILLPLLLFFGCASDSSEEINQKIAQYSSALESGNWQEVCSLISLESRQAVINNSGQETCPRGYETLPKAGRKQLRDSAKNTEVLSVDISGDKATAKINTEKGKGEVPLLRQDGTWRIHLFR